MAAARRAPRPRSASWVEVDLAAVCHNVRNLRDLLAPGCGVWAVVKANAYGHGAVPTARAALEGGATGLAVASYPEAAELRRAGIGASILLLSAGEPRLAAQVVRGDIIQTACHTAMAQALSKAAARLGRPARVHLKMDTGLGRLGVRPEQSAQFAQFLWGLPGLRLEGVFSHLATAEEADSSYVQEQLRRFRQALAAMAAVGIAPGVRHLANSAATLRFPEMRLDAVRVGLLIYGIRPDVSAPPQGLEALDLRPALSWKTRLAFAQRMPAGSPISYGGTHVTRGECTTGVLPLGYADGYPRRVSNRAHVLVRGQVCPVIGTVCMDHVIVDITSAREAQVGDEVVLIGQQGKHRVTANDLARWAETCLHEIPTVIGRRVQRVHLDSGRSAGPAQPG